MKKTIRHAGNYRFLTLAGAPADVEKEVNSLFNHGVVPSYPETFKAGEHSRVILQTYKANLASGLLALATAEMQLPRNAARRQAMKGKPELFHAACQSDAEALLAGFEREREEVVREVTNTPKVRERAIAENQEGEEVYLTPAQVRDEKRILAHWFGEGRDSASARGKSSAE